MESMSYWRLHYHLVWATYTRLPLITPPRERIICQTIFAKARDLGLIVHAIGMEDHLHVVVSIPPTLSLAQCVKQLKGASARAVNINSTEASFHWQEGYGALTIGGRSLTSVIEYVSRQAEHHGRGTTTQAYERINENRDGS
jgi:REP element-mobilizing transposase RayT